MQYVFSMTSRMVTIAITCAVLLCVLLFLLGMEIGARMNHSPPTAETAAYDAHVSPPVAATAPPVVVAQPSSPAAADMAALPASSTL
ncbi:MULTISPECIES: hypothetical protein [Paraburkholderia]|jgi:hypothetical protein|uniref:Uncharacterized protein n=1 Tax=Paraburkholderia hospita TaxID=169430 RepID=A0AAJ4X5X9_9BURK|nr:hypothetical protein [Paraburkholderia hospita]EUC20024.1 hypothetical protein PMI06_001823 [Burkholderia sp. BT03]SKC97654.1 hypothetical protein SAMN05445504_7225 [Burkholderia sp. CF099]SOE83177.1 hypothetical protein SAMN05446935_3574 [Burkholderia sp. YR290]AUT73438.1 hypothetical protein C2L64_34270 [Paraburkholderia hospita]EIM98920.1 hypothetical protein WQE_21131 [Paraburkholderia hospita]